MPYTGFLPFVQVLNGIFMGFIKEKRIMHTLRLNFHCRYPNNWRLNMSDVRKSDGGLYVCEISSFPPKVLLTRLRVKGED